MMAETAREMDVSREQSSSSVSMEGLWISLRCYALAISWNHSVACEPRALCESYGSCHDESGQCLHICRGR